MTAQPESHGFHAERPFRFGFLDLAAFGIFFALTLLLLPPAAIQVLQTYDPGLTFENLTGVQQVLLQGVMNLLLVGFIVFLVRVVHKRSFVDTIHWYRDYWYGTRLLLFLGGVMALTVLTVSSRFPPAEPPPIERLIASTDSLYVFVLFGIGVAPLVEEVIFRGFLFKVLSDLGGPYLAVSGTAGLFALLHIPQLWGSWAGIVLIFLVGCILSLLRLFSNSVIPPFLVHTAYNTMLFGVFVLGTIFQRSAGN